MKPIDNLYFLRTFRTSNSEVWLIDFNNERIGTIHLHFTKCIVGDIIFYKKVTKNQLKNILESLDHWIVSTIEDRDDFVFSVYQAKEVAFFSDIVDHDSFTPTRGELKEHGNLINRIISKYQDARGQLNEHVVKDYFSKLGFKSTKADHQFDKIKVDVIAENEKIIIYSQIKLGKIDNRKIFDICENISKINTSHKRRIAAIIADSFPLDIELTKEELELKFGLNIWTILKSQILNELPEYKRTLQ